MTLGGGTSDGRHSCELTAKRGMKGVNEAEIGGNKMTLPMVGREDEWEGSHPCCNDAAMFLQSVSNLCPTGGLSEGERDGCCGTFLVIIVILVAIIITTIIHPPQPLRSHILTAR